MLNTFVGIYLDNPKYLSLGSNQGNRIENLKQALSKLSEISRIRQVSPIYETPALLPEKSSESWNRAFLNLCVRFEYEGSPDSFLEKAKAIEKSMGRIPGPRWSPRIIDIDILVWGRKALTKEGLVIPHPEMRKRSFVLDPLKDMDGSYIKDARSLPQHSPLWMGILNLTPDSFSDGGSYLEPGLFIRRVESFCKQGVQILDLGAESTRPRAPFVQSEDEWQRLEPYLKTLKEIFYNHSFPPLISIDTYKPSIARPSIKMGADIINDVSGLRDPEMLSVLKESDVEYVLMHSLNVPADPNNTLLGNVTRELCDWLEQKLELLQSEGISLSRIIFDPGIGFGKTPLQSLQIIKEFESFHKYPIRLMVGHSRKSFLKSFSSENPIDRDIETLGVSMSLIQKKVDILRVHNPEIHIRMHKAWNHVAG